MRSSSACARSSIVCQSGVVVEVHPVGRDAKLVDEPVLDLCERAVPFLVLVVVGVEHRDRGDERGDSVEAALP
jgi:hypothetical protein